MSKLEELIQKLCPDGVEYKQLGDISREIYRGAGITREQVTPTGIPCVRYGEIYTTYGIWFDKCVSHTNESNITSKKYFEYGDILFAITGEKVKDISKSCAYLGHEHCLAGGDIVVLKHNQDPKYMGYVLSTADVQKQKSKGRIKSKVVHSNVPAIRQIKIPIPPLPVQREIVRILDNFTELTAELTAELIAELTARKKQYSFYSNKITSFDDTIPRIHLRGMVDFRNGKGHEKNIVPEGKYIVINSKFISTNGVVKKYSNEQTCPLFVDDILMVMSDLPNGRALAKCYLVESNDRYTLNQRIGAFHVKNTSEVDTKYLYYILNRNLQLLKFDNGVDQTNLRKDDILDINIPIPSLPEQERIVSILERFDTLCNDLTSGLPAEIEARKKQYEYYRDKLLTFMEKTA